MPEKLTLGPLYDASEMLDSPPHAGVMTPASGPLRAGVFTPSNVDHETALNDCAAVIDLLEVAMTGVNSSPIADHCTAMALNALRTAQSALKTRSLVNQIHAHP